MRKSMMLFLMILTMIGVVSTSAFAEESSEMSEQIEESGVTEAGDRIVELGYCSLTVPEEIAKICNIETDEDSVIFNEKIANEKHGWGRAGELLLYDSMRAYRSVPSFKWCGLLTLPDGSKQYMLLLYPTDMEHDIRDLQSSENYQKIQEALGTIIVDSIEATNGATYTPPEQIDSDSIYADILEKLTADLTEGKDMDGFEEDGFSYLYAFFCDPNREQDPDRVIGYAFMDLNHDGYDELLLGCTGDTDVYDLFTQVDGEVIHIFSGGERDVYTVLGHDGERTYYIRNIASGGASNTQITYYILAACNEELFTQTTLVYDAYTDPEHPYNVVNVFGTENNPLSEEEWNERQQRHGEPVEIPYTPLT